MEFRTPVGIPRPSFQIEPLEEMLFVGSCFADSIGRRFQEERFPATVNPFGTMYNPASVLHTIEQWSGTPRVVFITLGTNHVYRLKSSGEIVDNCQKRPQRLFQEETLSIEACASYLRQAVSVLRSRRPDVQVVFTVSPIRYQKYGFHESQLSKATLLLAVASIVAPTAHLDYFPAYEIVLDELRDYRFYKEDMLHPTAQAVEYIWQQLVEHYFSPAAKQFLQEWKPIKEALNHRPFHPESAEYQHFLAETRKKEHELLTRFGKS
ncbi:MAG: GSCFA domain-containing protein [Prevotella sp.]|nr:GSCFA domain-containing protein [Prevotella sp.]